MFVIRQAMPDDAATLLGDTTPSVSRRAARGRRYWCAGDAQAGEKLSNARPTPPLGAPV